MIKRGAARVATVFGGSGFIGRYIVQRLARDGWTVRVAGRDTEKAARLKPLGVVGQIAPMLANIRDDRSVAAAVEGADAVINLVGILFESGKNKFGAVQAEGAGRIARAAAASGVQHMIHVSAIGADPQSEAEYAKSKAAGEQAVFDAFAEAVILRPSIVFGPEDDFFNQFAAMARLAPSLPLIGGGKTRFQPVYVDDVAAAAMAAIARPDARGRVFELGGPRTYSFKDLMEHVLAVTGRKRALLPIPFGAATMMGAAGELLPKPFLTRDQVKLLKTDNVVADDAATLADLGVTPQSVEAITPSYLWRFRKSGRWAFKARKRGEA